MKASLLVSTAFGAALAAFSAAADGHNPGLPQSVADCLNRPDTGSYNSLSLDINQLMLQERALKVGCLLSLQDRGIGDQEALKTAIQDIQNAIANIHGEFGDHSIELMDNYVDPDGIIGPNFLTDFSAMSYYTSFFLPFLKDEETAYGAQNINSYYMKRFAAELRAQNSAEYDDMRNSFYADFDAVENDRFLDDQQIRCTGESSLPDYNGPCGNSVAASHVEEPLRPSKTTVTYGARLTV